MKKPRYLQVAQDVETQIRDGVFALGTLLPTENELCERYNVSRYTVREALRRLQMDGLISRRQGAGTVIEQIRPTAGYEQAIDTIDDLLQYAIDSVFRFTSDGAVAVDLETAQVLHCRPGHIWLKLHGLRRLPNSPRPVCLTEVYIDARFSDALTQLERDHGPLFQQLERLYGVHADSITQEIQAVALSAGQARRLGAETGAPGLRIVRRYRDAQGEVFEISVSHHVGDQFTYTMHLDKQGAR
jgi:GntR family transcriptional regulator